MKILYLSCHHVLEYDEIRVLARLGHQVISPGFYANIISPPSFQLRNEIPGYLIPNDLADIYSYYSQGKSLEAFKKSLPREFVQKFDLVIAMHDHEFITHNLDALRGLPVVWRSIGQSTPSIEKAICDLFPVLELRIVRYSPCERNIDEYAGEHRIVRFAKFVDDFPAWQGVNDSVITFCQMMKQRGDTCNFKAFKQITRKSNRCLYGPGNEGMAWMRGAVTDAQQKEILRDASIYVSCNTKPASYTLGFMEAWLTGIPVVALGKSFQAPYGDLYEVPLLIEDGVDGFIVDDIRQGRRLIRSLLLDRPTLEIVSRNGRNKSQCLFGEKAVLVQWEEAIKNWR